MTQSEERSDEKEEADQRQQGREHCSLNDFLRKLRLLRIDCALLHNSIEKSLLTSGICKRYTVGKEAKVAAQSTVVINGTVYRKSPKYAGFLSRCSSRNPSRNGRTRRLCQTSSSTPTFSARRRMLQKEKRPSWRCSSVSSNYSAASSVLESVRSESEKSEAKRKHWLPRITVPEPFQMTIRETTEPVRLTYSEKFLFKMLQEKREKEEEELKKLKIRFKAHPIPMTTYVPESNLYIGKLKRSKSCSPKSKFKEDVGEKAKVEGEEESLKAKKRFHSTPIPLSTFIRPSSSLEDLRKTKRHERAIQLLVESSEPAGLSDHSIRWHIRNRVRHVPRCFQDPVIPMRKHSRSMPDFQSIQLKFRDKLSGSIAKPVTVTKPFKFEAEIPSHHCWNWTEAMDVELKKLKKVFEDYKNN